MRVASAAITRGGVAASRKLAVSLPHLDRYVPAKLSPVEGECPFEGPVREIVARLWDEYDGLVLFAAVGAAVRLIAPHVKSKAADPAVVTVDEACAFAVSLVSGHVGGANALARTVAGALGATPVITTASEARGLPALDTLGREDGWRVEATPEELKRAAAALVDGRRAVIYQDAGDDAWQRSIPDEQRVRCRSAAELESRCDGAGLAILVTDRDVGDVRDRLAIPHVVYHPPSLVVGVGCSRGAPAEEIDELLRSALREAGLSAGAVAMFSTIDVKRGEAGIAALAATYDVPVRYYRAEELARVPAPNPSSVVEAAVGTPGVCEPAAMLAAGADGLVVSKRISPRATVAIVRAPAPLRQRGEWGPGSFPDAGEEAATDISSDRDQRTRSPLILPAPPRWSGSGGAALAVVGLGPGGYADLTNRAEEALRTADRIVGYARYTASVKAWLPGATYVESELGEETDRCTVALDLAAAGHRVTLVSSGDAGIYAMAGLVYELAWQRGWRFADPAWPQIEVIPGVTAASAAAALVGAPLMSDFAAISLSDLMTPWATIERRLRGAAAGDFVVALYNPMSRRRDWQLARARALLLERRDEETPVAIVREACRPGQSVRVTTLAELEGAQVDMLSIVIVGNSATRVLGGRMVTLRGYPTGATR